MAKTKRAHLAKLPSIAKMARYLTRKKLSAFNFQQAEGGGELVSLEG